MATESSPPSAISGADHMCAEIARILGRPKASPAETLEAVRDLKALQDIANEIFCEVYFGLRVGKRGAGVDGSG